MKPFIVRHRVVIVISLGTTILILVLIWLAVQGIDQANRAGAIRAELNDASPSRLNVPTPSPSQGSQDEISRQDRLGLEKDLLQIESARYVAGVQLVIGLLVVAGGLGGLHFTRKTLLTNQRGQVTDRFTKAIDQLGRTVDKGAGHEAEPLLEIRLGGLYALERIARDSGRSDDDYIPVVVEVLGAYIRGNAPLPVPDASGVTIEEERQRTGRKPRADIQTALTVLGRLEPKPPLDLSRVSLGGADLSGANLSRANLSGTDLSQANLTGANLTGANLTGADLVEANLFNTNLSRAGLSEANLSGAILVEATLSRANLFNANLSRANLFNANLSRAGLVEADLSGADLSVANLSGANLSVANLSGASLFNATLSEARGLVWDQLAAAQINRQTVLPANLAIPEYIQSAIDGLEPDDSVIPSAVPEPPPLV